ncbi:MAG: hypothetical protein LC795_11230 [Acidobacteria bacterium]|nr:hypothetical protein [Acidobacteriota bacterium]MCA1619863.1 hypothetical protein [Acidobacteriota bacterium]
MNGDAFFNAVGRALACAGLVGSVGLAQAGAQTGRGQSSPPPPPDRVRSNTLRVELPTPVAETPVPFEDGRRPGGLQTLSFVTPDTNFELEVVKGSPFSGDAVTEHAQRLGGGNRMVRKSSARLFRDSDGRTRREHLLTRGGGAAAPDGQEPRLIRIADPVAQVEYLVDTVRGTIRKTHLTPGLAEARRRAGGTEGSFGVLMPTSAARRREASGEQAASPPAPKREKLEPQLIEGLTVEGTRTTVTIPAGEFDNEQPLEITHEQWYSPELRMVVLLKHNDPRFGETVFRLTGVTRTEPAPELFAEPQGYRAEDRREMLRGRPVMGRP